MYTALRYELDLILLYELLPNPLKSGTSNSHRAHQADNIARFYLLFSMVHKPPIYMYRSSVVKEDHIGLRGQVFVF